MCNGSGDEYSLLFTPVGAIMKGFDHESPMTSYRHDPPKPWPGVLDHVPAVFVGFLAEPAFMIADVSFCLWRTTSDDRWRIGPIDFPNGPPDPDGSAHLLSILDGDPRTYVTFAGEYFGDEAPASLSFPLDLIERIYRHEPLTEEIVAGLNPAIGLADVREDAADIGCPVAR